MRRDGVAQAALEGPGFAFHPSAWAWRAAPAAPGGRGLPGAATPTLPPCARSCSSAEPRVSPPSTRCASSRWPPPGATALPPGQGPARRRAAGRSAAQQRCPRGPVRRALQRPRRARGRSAQTDQAEHPDGVVVLSAAVNDYCSSTAWSWRRAPGELSVIAPRRQAPSGGEELVIRLRPAGKVIDQKRARLKPARPAQSASSNEGGRACSAPAQALLRRVAAELVVANSLCAARCRRWSMPMVCTRRPPARTCCAPWPCASPPWPDPEPAAGGRPPVVKSAEPGAEATGGARSRRLAGAGRTHGRGGGQPAG